MRDARNNGATVGASLAGALQTQFGTVRGQWNETKKVKGRKQPKTLRAAWKRLGLNTKFVIARYQFLGIFGGGTARTTYPAGFVNEGLVHGITGGGQFDLTWLDIPGTWRSPPGFANGNTGVALPVYAFNLTSLPQTLSGGVAVNTCPFYRLVKLAGITGTPVQYSYQWVPMMQETNTYAYTIENSNTAITNEPNFQHLWSQFNLAYYGATSVPTDVTMEQVSFNGTYGPNRLYYNGGFNQTTAPLAYDSLLAGSSSEAWLEASTVWDSWMAGKINHPLQKSVNNSRTKIYNSHWKDNFRLTEDTTINKDARPVQLIKKNFVRDGRYLRGVSAVGEYDAANSVIATDGSVQSGFNKTAEYTVSSAFPHRHHDKWMLIYSTNYNNTQDASAPLPSVSTDASFDIQVRSKWAMVN